MLRTCSYIGFVFLSICFFTVKGQQYSFRNFTVTDGLGSAVINHIYQDSRGYWWFATQNGGISRFNGRSFKTFTKKDGLVNQDVTNVAEVGDSVLWIATAGGVSIYNGKTFTNYGPENGLKGVIYATHEDTEGRVWLAVEQTGVVQYLNKKFTPLKGLPQQNAYTLCSRKDEVWMGLQNGVACLKSGKLTLLDEHPLIKGHSFFCSYVDSEGNVWMGSTAGRVVRIHIEGTLTELKLPATVKDDFIGSITGDHNGNLWIATDHGVLKYDGAGFKLLTTREGLSVNAVQTLLTDYENNIWIGTLNGGVDVLSSEAFIQFNEKHQLPANNITALAYHAGNNHILLGTETGLYWAPLRDGIMAGKPVQINGTSGMSVSGVTVTDGGDVWVCALNGINVFRSEGAGYKHIKHIISIDGVEIVSPLQSAQDTAGNIWVATYGSGVVCIRGDKAERYSTENGFYTDKVLCVSVFDGSVWFGTQDTGLLRYGLDGFSHVSVTGKRPVWAVSTDHTGGIFTGVDLGELWLIKNNVKYTITGTEESQTVATHALYFDTTWRVLWAGSDNGLEQVTKSPVSGTWKRYRLNRQDGFKPVSVCHHGLIKAADNRLWVGTVNGLWSYTNTLANATQTAPKLILEDIRVFYQAIDWLPYTIVPGSFSGLPYIARLPHTQNHMTFEVQGLSTGEVMYRYLLEGQDAEWTVPTPNNQITYTNLKPGRTYVFKVKAIFENGEEGPETKLFEWEITPPWWNTWWFWGLCFLGFVFLLMGTIRAREKVLRERNINLEATVRERTQQIEQQKAIVEKALGEKETLLQEKDVLLREIHHRVKNNLQTISSMLMLQSAGLRDEQAKSAIAESQSRVRSIALVHQKLYQTDGIEKVELSAFVSDLTQQVQSLFAKQKHPVTIHIHIPETYLLIDTAIPLGLILNELLTNSYKYAFTDKSSGEIKITAEKSSETDVASGKVTHRITLCYTDNGPGIPLTLMEGQPASLGLRLIRLLSRQIGAAMNYDNRNGSTFTFMFSNNL